ncbi:MAG: cupin domain-containing protein [Pseudomonadota bacterium]
MNDPIQSGNLLDDAPPPVAGERLDTLLTHGGVVIERIVSAAAITPTEYVQPQDEWVALLRGEALLEVAGKAHALKTGDYLFLPSGTPQTVLKTSEGALWLAVHVHRDAQT